MLWITITNYSSIYKLQIARNMFHIKKFRLATEINYVFMLSSWLTACNSNCNRPFHWIAVIHIILHGWTVKLALSCIFIIKRILFYLILMIILSYSRNIYFLVSYAYFCYMFCILEYTSTRRVVIHWSFIDNVV